MKPQEKRIPLSKANFKEIIKENFIYVDKTKFLYDIVNSYEPYYFLIRPRRFGKSLFISTLESFFKGEKELFKDLYIYDQNWTWQEHPIIKLDFNFITANDPIKFKANIRDRLEKVAKLYGVKIKKKYPEEIFRDLIPDLADKYKKGVVVLVDEYDKPIISNLGKGKESSKIAEENMEFMKIFYDNLKALEENLRLVFITGISKFTKVSIFSTLNNLIEIDKEPSYAEILGYTEEELFTYFPHYFNKLAQSYEMTIKEVKKKFKSYYNGFRFTEADKKVYNPYSCNKALHFSRIDNFWFETATPNFLANLIKEKKFDVTVLEKMKIDKEEIKAYDIEKLQLIPLLFQTGYLTIKDTQGEFIYTLAYPNFEVERGFNLHLLKSFSDESIKSSTIQIIKEALLKNKYDQFITYIKSLFASIANINIPKELQEKEAYYQTMFYLTAVLFTDNSLGVNSELLTSKGRIDMVVESEKNIFIIEFKCNQSAEKAIQQIKDKNYRERFIIKEKQIILIGINFDTEQRDVADYLIVEDDF